MLFIKVAENENEESIELPIEPQGHLLMSTLIAQFPGACGLKFKTEQFSWRGYNYSCKSICNMLYNLFFLEYELLKTSYILQMTNGTQMFIM